MKNQLFVLKIIKQEGKGFKFQSRNENINIYEVIALLRRYCDEVEKKFLDSIFKNMVMSQEQKKEEK